ncbi:thioredoxin family protein [Flavisolibacter ginsenosidimutans]|uniref:Thioredoxin family protein n=1 Tax=Flavisolibacter ginsenosidimutans TaxID=661481 RepID=A0A5B8UL44_9BACT|nr:thioredoxin family protein [Flavisolibacter ginsenosidimutans]QEC56735.1 thioredoxin family protein [Flavisolibacter ginsenosidimutans]
MKFLSVFILSLFLNNPPVWQNDFEKAAQEAKSEHKYVLLSFSGSDWCIPCIRLHKEVFDSKEFTSFAEPHLVLVNADFPRLNKNQLPKEQQKRNNQLADKFDPEGHFPYTVLLNEEGKVVKTWDGYPNANAAEFTTQLKDLMHVQ